MMDNLSTPTAGSGPRPVEHRSARKAYFSPELKVYGKMSELTAGGTQNVNEFVPGVDPNCNSGNPFSPCQP